MQSPPSFGLAVPLWLSPAARVALLDAAAIAGLGDGRVVLVETPDALCRVFAQKHPVAAGADGPASGRAHLFVDVGATHATAVVARFFAPGEGPEGRSFEVRIQLNATPCLSLFLSPSLLSLILQPLTHHARAYSFPNITNPPTRPPCASSTLLPKVLASASSPSCGVQAYDLALFPLCRAKAAATLKKPDAAQVAVPGSKSGLRLMRGVGQLRKLLSTLPEASVVVENVGDDRGAAVSLTRQEFGDACGPVLEAFSAMLTRCLADANVAYAQAAATTAAVAAATVAASAVNITYAAADGAAAAAEVAAATPLAFHSVEGLGGGVRMPPIQDVVLACVAAASGLASASAAATGLGSKVDSSALAFGAALAAAEACRPAAAPAAPESPEAPEAPEAPAMEGEVAAPPAASASTAALAKPPGLSVAVLAAAVADEAAMAAVDWAVRAVAEARNGVESYVLSMRQAADDRKHGHLVTNRDGLMQVSGFTR